MHHSLFQVAISSLIIRETFYDCEGKILYTLAIGFWKKRAVLTELKKQVPIYGMFWAVECVSMSDSEEKTNAGFSLQEDDKSV